MTWANITPVAFSLERQATVPLFGDTPVELGLTLSRDLAPRLRAVPLYEDLFAEAFPEEEDPINDVNVTKAIAAFERTLISGRSPFDRWFFEGDESALSDSAKRGYELFNGHPFECFHCHGGFNFSDQATWAGVELPDMPPYHNTGLYNIDGEGGYPENNTGLFTVTGKPEDMGRFKVPTLRNIALTAPYMHDGSIATLSEVLDHYAAGGRTIEDGPYAGDGSKNPFKSVLVPGFPMTEQERADTIAFLESLTDEEFVRNSKFSDPWE